MMNNSYRSTKILVLPAFLLIFLGGLLIWQGLRVVEQSGQQSEPTTPSGSAVYGISREQVLVTRVVDGDTIEIANGQRVRYIGIDTPETLDPRRPIGCFGREAAIENKRLVEGKRVILVKDVSDTDRFNRLLRYLYLELPSGDMLFVNDYLTRQGFAKASTYPPDLKFTNQFVEAEKEARENNRGLWRKCI